MEKNPLDARVERPWVAALGFVVFGWGLMWIHPGLGLAYVGVLLFVWGAPDVFD